MAVEARSDSDLFFGRGGDGYRGGGSCSCYRGRSKQKEHRGRDIYVHYLRRATAHLT